MGQQTWAGAAREVWRTAARHKIASGLVALCVAGSLVAITVAGSGSAGPAGAAAGPAKRPPTRLRRPSASPPSGIPGSTWR